MGRMSVVIEVTFSPFATRTMALGALVSTFCMGAARAMYIWVAPESTIPVALVGRSGWGVVGLQACISDQVIRLFKLLLNFSELQAVPPRHSSHPLFAIEPPFVLARVASRLFAGMSLRHVAEVWPLATL